MGLNKLRSLWSDIIGYFQDPYKDVDAHWQQGDYYSRAMADRRRMFKTIKKFVLVLIFIVSIVLIISLYVTVRKLTN